MPANKDLVSFKLEVAGAKQLDFRLGLLRTNVTNLSDLWPDVDELLRGMEEEQFRTQGARGGKEWVKLSDNPKGKGYATWKTRHYPNRPILVREGHLKKSLTQPGGDHVFIPGRMGMSFGTTVPYGLFHQTGAPVNRLPARPPIKLLKKADAVKIANLMQEFIFKSGQGYQRTLI